MSDGDITKYNEIKKLDAIKEFWGFFDLWREKQLKNIENARNRLKKRRAILFYLLGLFPQL